MSSIETVNSELTRFFHDKKFNLTYDSQIQKYTPWYKIPFLVNFEKRKGRASTNIAKRKIKIPILNESYKTLDDLAAGFIHETGHIDIFPVETPIVGIALAYGIYEMYFGNFIEGISVCAAGIGYMEIGGEFVVEFYNKIKHGSKYTKIRGGIKQMVKKTF